jgi:hypothetical protein
VRPNHRYRGAGEANGGIIHNRKKQSFEKYSNSLPSPIANTTIDSILSPDTAELKKELENTSEKSKWDDSYKADDRADEKSASEEEPFPLSQEEQEEANNSPSNASRKTEVEVDEISKGAQEEMVTPRKANPSKEVTSSARKLCHLPSRV